MRKNQLVKGITAIAMASAIAFSFVACGNKKTDNNKTETLTATIANLDIGVGQTRDIAPVYSGTAKTGAWTLTPADTLIATASGISVTGVKAGNTTVAATDSANNVSANFTVTVHSVKASAQDVSINELETTSLNLAIELDNENYAPDSYDENGWSFTFTSKTEGATVEEIVTYNETTTVLSPTGTKFGTVTVTAKQPSMNDVEFDVTVTEVDYLDRFNADGSFEKTNLEATDFVASELNLFGVENKNAVTGSNSLAFNYDFSTHDFGTDTEATVTSSLSYEIKHLTPNEKYTLSRFTQQNGYVDSVYVSVYDSADTDLATSISTNKWLIKNGNYDLNADSFTAPASGNVKVVLTVVGKASSTDKGWAWAAIDDFNIVKGDFDYIQAKSFDIVATTAPAVTNFADLVNYVTTSTETQTLTYKVTADKTEAVVDAEAKTVTVAQGYNGIVKYTVEVLVGETSKGTVDLTIEYSSDTSISRINTAGQFSSTNGWGHTAAGWSSVVTGNGWIDGDTFNGEGANAKAANLILSLSDLNFSAVKSYAFAAKAQGGSITTGVYGKVTLAIYASGTEMTEDAIKAATALYTKTVDITEKDSVQTLDLGTLSGQAIEGGILVLTLAPELGEGSDEDNTWLCLDDLTVTVG